MNKKFALIFCLPLLVTLAFAFTPKQPHYKANVYVIKETVYGTETIASHNIITDIGERYARNLLGFDNVTANNATKWIALGNSTADAGDTKLDTEATSLGFTRALGTVTAWDNSGDKAYNVTYKFTATGNIQINATALQWSGVSNSDNNCYAISGLGGSQDFQNNWNCTIIWVVTYNFN